MKEWESESIRMTYLLFPRSRSNKPSVCLWKSNTNHATLFNMTSNSISRSLPKWARSDINKRSVQLVTPRDSFFSISSTNSGRFTTQPFPIHSETNLIRTVLCIPKDAYRWYLYSSASENRMEAYESRIQHHQRPHYVQHCCHPMNLDIRDGGASLRFTWHRQTTSASDASKSTSLPLPYKKTPPSTLRYSLRHTSSPHWAPRTMATIDGLGNGCTVTLSRRLAVGGRDVIRLASYLENWNRSFLRYVCVFMN